MFDAFLKIDGIDGESTADKHEDWIELLGFNTGLSQPASASKSSAGGATAARADFNDFTIEKTLDIATPKIASYCARGEHIAEITIDLCRAGGEEAVTYMQYIMKDVIISAVTTGGTCDADFPTETLCFNFASIEWKYTKQKRAGGGGGGQVTAGWDLAKGKKL